MDASKYLEIPRLTFDDFFQHHSQEGLSNGAPVSSSNISV